VDEGFDTADLKDTHTLLEELSKSPLSEGKGL
jgi:hypothetical protein